jgi:hypothetical protein
MFQTANQECIGKSRHQIDMLPTLQPATFHRSSPGPHCARPGADPWTQGPWILQRHLPELPEL